MFDALHPQIHPHQVRPARLPDDVDLVVGDVTDPDAVAACLAHVRPDVIVHLAAETGTGQSLHQASRHALVNVVGVTRLLDAITTTGVAPSHLVLASSRAVYGEGQWIDTGGTVFSPGHRSPGLLANGTFDPPAPSGRPASALVNRAGATPTAPTSIYGATKLAQEHVLDAWCAATATPLSILRLQNVFGPGQSLTNPHAGVLTTFAQQAGEDLAIEVFEDGAITRDFVFVDDAVAALEAAVRRPPTLRRVLDIGSGRITTLHAVAALIASAAGARPPAVSGRYRLGDVRAAGCDTTAAADEIGYRPAWSLERGLAELLATVREHGRGDLQRLAT